MKYKQNIHNQISINYIGSSINKLAQSLFISECF